MIERHLLKLRARHKISEAEESAILDAVSEYREVPASRALIRPHVKLRESTLLLDGWLCSYKDVSDGSRQITALYMPGDFVDLQGFTLEYLDHPVMSMTAARLAIVPHDQFSRLTDQCPHLTKVYWHDTNLQAAIHREWEVSLGRRNAIAKVAAFFCEVLFRLHVVGLTDGTKYELPFTQTDVGNCIGLTSVHVNRQLRELRDQRLLTFRERQVTIHNLAELQRVAEFDPKYLFLSK